MNAFRTRLNVLNLEGRDMPSATVGLPAPEPTYLTIKLKESLVTNLTAGGQRPAQATRGGFAYAALTVGGVANQPQEDGVRDLLVINSARAGGSSGLGGGKVAMQDFHFAVDVGTGDGGSLEAGKAVLHLRKAGGHE